MNVRGSNRGSSLGTAELENWLDVASLDQQFADLEAAGMEEGPIGHTLKLLGKIAVDLEIPIAVVGGIASNFYGLKRTTEDVDVVIDETHLARFREKAAAAGFVEEGPARFCIKGGYPVDVLVSGTYPTPDSLHPVPTPAELGVVHGLGYAHLAAWISLKLLASRPEDIGDVYRLLRRKTHAERQDIQAKLDPRARGKYQKVLEDLKRRMS